MIEALGSTDLNLLVDVGFNKEVAENCALYWSRKPGYVDGKDISSIVLDNGYLYVILRYGILIILHMMGNNGNKLDVLSYTACGIVSIVAEIVLIKFFGLGLYAIVLSTTVVMIIRYVVFNSFYAAWCLKKNMAFFLPTVLKTWLSIPALIILMVLIRTVLPIHSWIGLCLDAVIAGGLGYAFMLVVYGRAGFVEVARNLNENEVVETQMQVLKAKKGSLHNSVRYHMFTQIIDYVFKHNLYEKFGVKEYNRFCKFYRKLCESQKL